MHSYEPLTLTLSHKRRGDFINPPSLGMNRMVHTLVGGGKGEGNAHARMSAYAHSYKLCQFI